LAQETAREDGFDPAQLVEHSRFKPEEMLAELRQLAGQHIADEPLRRLVLMLLERHSAALCRLPATVDRFYPFVGGLVEHLLSVTKTCLWLVERYRDYYTDVKPPLNKDLVVAGAILHDIGRVVELDEAAPLTQTPQPTVPGRLFGHVLLGQDLVREAAREQGDVNPELVRLLEHIIISHLTLPEWGSPRLPLVPE